jgi:hypothetical protein
MTTIENVRSEPLPIPVRDYPHWRVTYRPATYDEQRVKSLSECRDIVTKHRVRLRGWDFPPLPPATDEMAYGSRWIAAWSDFMGHLEYWRFYQSTQFLYLGSVREVTEPDWAEKLRASQHFIDRRDISKAPGFLSITNFVYNITEIFEFAARLSQSGVYFEPLDVTIRITGIKGFILAADPSRMWPNAYSASEPELSFQETLTPAELVANAADVAVNCIVWFFERFGWLNPNVSAIRTDQQRLLTGKF